MPGPIIRTDIVEVYIFRHLPFTGPPDAQRPLAIEFLQLRRAKGPMIGGWHPVMGHIEEGETATQAALRELAEETGYKPGRGLTAFWQLELINSYFLASIDAVMLSPGFAAEVDYGVEPIIDDSHDALRWVPRDHADRTFLWPGQRHAAEHIVRDILPAGSLVGPRLKIPL